MRKGKLTKNIRYVNSQSELNTTINQYIVNGYKIQKETDASVILNKPYNGSLGIHILFFLISAGFLNLIYFFECRFSKKNKMEFKIKK